MSLDWVPAPDRPDLLAEPVRAALAGMPSDLTSQVQVAEIDPDHLWTLDHNRLNNSITTETDPAPALAFTTDLLYWFQLLMAATGLVG